MITWVYGGAEGSLAARHFGLDGEGIDNMQFFASRGYAVLFPDAPLRIGSPVKDLLSTVTPAVRRAIDIGVADPDRLGVMGQSYGGYSVFALISHINLFRAAVARAAQANLISFSLTFRDATGDAVGLPWAERGQGRMGGPLWQFRTRYIENSPIFYLDQVQTPVLLVHGGMDQTVPSYLGDELFVSLRRLGKTVIYVKYPNEDHWEGDWSISDMTDELQRIVAFFDSNLKVRAS